MSNKSLWKSNSFFICVSLFLFVFGASVDRINAQEERTRQVAVITDNSGKTRTIIYSDLLFQLALQPDVPLDPPRTEDLKRAFQNVIDQSLIGLELGGRKPFNTSIFQCLQPTSAEIDLEVRRVSMFFRTPSEFEERLRFIGFDSIKDENFFREMGFRVTIQKWLDLGFRSFMIITPEEEENYYQDVFSPEFRRRQPGLILPELQQQRSQIRQILTERKVENEIKKFLEFARKQVEISILIDELK